MSVGRIEDLLTAPDAFRVGDYFVTNWHPDALTSRHNIRRWSDQTDITSRGTGRLRVRGEETPRASLGVNGEMYWEKYRQMLLFHDAGEWFWMDKHGVVSKYHGDGGESAFFEVIPPDTSWHKGNTYHAGSGESLSAARDEAARQGFEYVSIGAKIYEVRRVPLASGVAWSDLPDDPDAKPSVEDVLDSEMGERNKAGKWNVADLQLSLAEIGWRLAPDYIGDEQ